jgi:hypothetical protein
MRSRRRGWRRAPSARDARVVHPRGRSQREGSLPRARRRSPSRWGRWSRCERWSCRRQYRQRLRITSKTFRDSDTASTNGPEWTPDWPAGCCASSCFGSPAAARAQPGRLRSASPGPGAPGVGELEALGARVVRIEQELVDPGDPRPPGDRRHDYRVRAANGGAPQNPLHEAGADHALVHELAPSSICRRDPRRVLRARAANRRGRRTGRAGRGPRRPRQPPAPQPRRGPRRPDRFDEAEHPADRAPDLRAAGNAARARACASLRALPQGLVRRVGRPPWPSTRPPPRLRRRWA